MFWGYDGIFTYNLGEDKALNVLPAYEAPCNWEGVMYCALPDGRIVFADCSQYSHEGEKIKKRSGEHHFLLQIHFNSGLTPTLWYTLNCS